ncbi:hypothetical protein [Rahnella contaminans]|uniref:hypothetical protein n=1 Tax=Rahnella contaminans TaxID=2703882 RepID=UPI0023DBEC45|nr:hypothetical protein [Rahnella contaminans]MDF1895074.1 hypothetical protein [Rahnella contaminans]
MTKYQPLKKGTVLALSGGVDHLHVICNDPVHYPIDGCDCVLAVNISSVKHGVPHDSTCILQIGDHPFIRHDSYVVYERAVIWKVINVDKKVSEGSIKPQPANIPDEIFKRILDGFDISDDVEPKVRRFWKAHC